MGKVIHIATVDGELAAARRIIAEQNRTVAQLYCALLVAAKLPSLTTRYLMTELEADGQQLDDAMSVVDSAIAAVAGATPITSRRLAGSQGHESQVRQ